jgi:hypothetical protein
VHAERREAMDELERVAVYRGNTIVSIIRLVRVNIYQARILVLDEVFQSTSLGTEVFATSPEEASVGAIQYAKQWIDGRDEEATADE